MKRVKLRRGPGDEPRAHKNKQTIPNMTKRINSITTQ
jgi:hypothetical protein